MGVKYNRRYQDIVADLAGAIGTIEDSYELIEMEADDWTALDADERREYLRTLADDLFYGLGSSPRLSVGSGKIEYDPGNHVLKVYTSDNLIHLIQLI